ncbi:GNAT family N-acetyltransferase [Sabulilitoribacter arenilitoris]|uniref:GNAT family N-acetyltransferase n=1 Tax=Wocania arenilitoris TaxID=2044858 RepID=A0AAE3ENN6_9FLAO|nr:GNAT family N-acetyltransferase [Wocania arenilitoris]MCF7568218.1 GNAT family N-acetyltransferase [Wocania arenilitoris]
MLKLVRTDFNNTDFASLVKKLNFYLKTVDGDDHDFYNQYNNIDILKYVVVAYYKNVPVGCGAFKKFDKNSAEIKRMYTNSNYRNEGVASKILNELEIWSKEIGYNTCVLETGKKQTEAIQFYKKNNYTIIPNFYPYKNMANSLCFKKEIM